MDVTRVPVPAAGAPGGETNAYVAGRDPGVLVDPAGRTDALDDAVADRGVEHVAVTHAHADHVGGVGAYADALDATVWARAGRADRFAAAAGRPPDATFREGTRLPGGLGVVETPGHAPDHVAFAADGVALVGDLAVAEGSVAVAAPEGDVRAYLASLRRVLARGYDRLLPGHGPPIDDSRARLTALAAHRREREDRVLAAVREGACTVPDILDAAYEKDLSGVRDLAARTVRAHLGKLAVEKRVGWDGEYAWPPEAGFFRPRR